MFLNACVLLQNLGRSLQESSTDADERVCVHQKGEIVHLYNYVLVMMLFILVELGLPPIFIARVYYEDNEDMYGN